MRLRSFSKSTDYPRSSGTLLEQLQRTRTFGPLLASATLVAWSDLEPVRYLCLGFPTRIDLAGARAMYIEIADEVERITGVETNVVLMVEGADSSTHP